jgi:phage N-6-adenine-methyltransferase
VTLVGHRASNHPQQVDRRGALKDVDDRRTPLDLLAECANLAGIFGRFDLDVAASSDNHKAVHYYDQETDGLANRWYGVVWCNPPYSQCRAWVQKAHAESDHCQTIAMLLPANRTEQRWWQELVEPHRRRGELDVYFLAGRRRFDRPGWTKPAKGDRPPFGLCLVVWR